MSKIPLIIIVGPTASGKTSLSIEIAKKLNTEIVSADSMQLYKYMDIGTAKPTKEEMQGIPHHIMDEIDPSVNFSVAQYAELAHKYISEIYKKGKIPVMVGGTGLYVQAVADDLSFEEEDEDLSIRNSLNELAEKHGAEYLIEMLREFDPVSAERLHPNNLRRVVRAIEFYKKTGVPISEHQENTKKTDSRYNPIMFAINWDRQVLYDRIDKRVDIMINDGLIDEVKKLLDMGYLRSCTAMKGIGYKEVIHYLRGFGTLDETINIIKRNSRRYAKRQLTWFRRDKRIHWLDYNDNIAKNAMEIIERSVREEL